MYKGETKSPGMVILLSLVTCGIYGMIWMWNHAKDINGITGREEISPGLAIASMFVPFIIILFWQKSDNALVEVSAQKGLSYNSNFMLWVILLFVSYVGYWIYMYQAQEALNKIWEAN